MFPWLPYALAIYMIALICGTVLSFRRRAGKRRRAIRIASAIFSIPLWLSIAGSVWIWYHFLREPPTLTELQNSFAKKHGDLEIILRMSDEDQSYSRVAPDWLDHEPADNVTAGRYIQNDPKAPLRKTRWDEYRKIFARNGIELGIQRNSSRDAFIMVRSVGILEQGHASGYLYCAPTSQPNAYRYEPCSQKLDAGDHKYTGGEEGYSFRRLDGRWFAYDQGPG